MLAEQKCPRCDGHGVIDLETADGRITLNELIKCPDCKGSGKAKDVLKPKEGE